MNDNKKIIVKSILYRIFSTIITWLIAWIVSGDLYVGLTIGMFDVIIKVFTYFFYEKLWNKFIK